MIEPRWRSAWRSSTPNPVRWLGYLLRIGVSVLVVFVLINLAALLLMNVPMDAVEQAQRAADGWAYYNLLYFGFSQIGLATYPFLKMIYDNWRRPAESASSVTPSALVSLQQMKWALFFKALVLILAVMPLSNLSLDQLQYRRQCGGTVTESLNFGSTGTTFDAVDEPVSTESVKVPILWHILMQIASGVNFFAIAQMPCVDGIAELDTQLRNVALDDLALKNEYSRFFSECYVRARNKLHTALEGSEPDFFNFVNDALNSQDYDKRVIEELDSDFFRNTPGFYARCESRETCRYTLQAQAPVVGFAYNPQRDAAMPPSQAAKGVGQPYCGEWWENLRTRLIAAAQIDRPLARGVLGGSLVDNIDWLATNVTHFVAPDDVKEKLVLRSLVRSNPPDFTGIYQGEPSEVQAYLQRQGELVNKYGLDGFMTGLTGAAATGAGFLALNIPGFGDAAGQAVGQLAGFYVSLYITKKAAPMVQALVLMLIYMLLPLYLIISEYEVEPMLTGLILVFTVRFFSVVFAVAEYMENSLFQAMYPELATWGSMVTMGIDRLILNMVVLMMYVFGPSLLLYLVTMAGQKIANSGSSGDSSVGKVSGTGGAIGNSAGSPLSRVGERSSATRRNGKQ